MEIKKKTLGYKQFEQLYKSKDLIPDEYAISGKQIASRYETEGCRFLFVQNEADGLVYCYFQPEEKAKAVLISRGTVDKALNIYRGNKFLQSINVSEDNSAIAEALAEMQSQPDFMTMFAQVAKKATVVAQSVIVEVPAEEAIVAIEEKETRYVEEVNNLIGEGMRMKKSMTVEGLLEQRTYLVGQRDELLVKYAELEAKFNNGKADLSAAEELVSETSSYIDALAELREQYDILEGNYAQLGDDYLTLEKEKEEMEKAHAKEIKEFNRMYKELWGKFVNMKGANSHNSAGARVGVDAYFELNEQHVELGHKFLDLFKKFDETERKLTTTQKQYSATGEHLHRTRAELRHAQSQTADAQQLVTKLKKKLKKSESEYNALKNLNEKQLSELVEKCLKISGTQRITEDDLAEVLNAFTIMAVKNKNLADQLNAITLKKAEAITADINANKEKVLRLVNSDGEKLPVYLAVGPHYNPEMRVEGKTGKDFQSLYVIAGGDPTTQYDKDGNIIDIEKVLVDEKLRGELNIRCVHEIQLDKNGNAKIVYYDRDNKGVVAAKYSHEVKDIDVDEMKKWVEENYGAGKVKDVKALGFISSTLKANKILKGVALTVSTVLVAGALTFGGFVGWYGDQSKEAKEYGAKRIEAFVDGLQNDQTLFQYGEALDAHGSRINYVKTVNGQEVLVAGNKITAISNANRVFYKDAEEKVEIPVYKQQGFWGQLRKYDEPTILGAAYQLGAEVVSELTANGVPVYYETNGQKQPIYTYLNNANVSDYSQRSSMVSYLTENGNSEVLAEKIVASYEEGFKSGLNNGLSNKVENMIGSNDVLIPEVPPVSFVEIATKIAIANKVASKTLQGKKYTADELHVVYSDLDTDGEQVLFVMASKEADKDTLNANKYLYKIVLGDGSKEITSENINEAIANAENVTESIKLEVMFKADKYASATANYYDKNSSGSIAYVSNYALSQNGNAFSVTPTITVYNSQTGVVTEDTAKYTVQVAAGAQSSITEMCAVALLSDYGYFDEKNIYVAAPIVEAKATSKVYNDNEKTLG